MTMVYIHTRMIFYSDKRQFIFLEIQIVLNICKIPVIINERKSHNSIIYHSFYTTYITLALVYLL